MWPLMLGLRIVKFNYRRSKPSLSLILTEPFPSLAITFCVSNLFRPVAQSHSSSQTRAGGARQLSTYREINEWLRSLTFCGNKETESQPLVLVPTPASAPARSGLMR